MDDVAEFAVELAAKSVGIAAELAIGFIFSGYGARYFHAIGRRVIAIVTFGRKRIPSSKRVVPKGMIPRPRANDWLALWVGVATFIFAAAGVIAAFLV